MPNGIQVGDPIPAEASVGPQIGMAIPDDATIGQNIPIAPLPKINMQESVIPKLVRGATSALPAVGATAGGLATSPGVVTSAAGAGLGAALGESARLAANRALFGNGEPTNYSKEGLKSTAIQGGTAAATAGVLAAAPKIAGALSDLSPSARAAKAASNFSAVEGAIGEHTVAMTDDLAKSLGDIKEGIDTGLNAPSVINKFVSRIADTDQPPLTYTEARKFYSNMGDLATSEKMAANAKMQRLIFQVQNALGDAIESTADSGGRLAQYQQAMKGYAGAMKSAERIGTLSDMAKKAAITAAIGGAGYGTVKKLSELAGK